MLRLYIVIPFLILVSGCRYFDSFHDRMHPNQSANFTIGSPIPRQLETDLGAVSVALTTGDQNALASLFSGTDEITKSSLAGIALRVRSRATHKAVTSSSEIPTIEAPSLSCLLQSQEDTLILQEPLTLENVEQLIEHGRLTHSKGNRSMITFVGNGNRKVYWMPFFETTKGEIKIDVETIDLFYQLNSQKTKEALLWDVMFSDLHSLGVRKDAALIIHNRVLDFLNIPADGQHSLSYRTYGGGMLPYSSESDWERNLIESLDNNMYAGLEVLNDVDKSSSNFNFSESGNPCPLALAIRSGNISMIRELSNRHASLQYLSGSPSRPAWFYFAEAGRPKEVLGEILSIDSSLNLNSPDRSGLSILDICILERRQAALKAILEVSNIQFSNDTFRRFILTAISADASWALDIFISTRGKESLQLLLSQNYSVPLVLLAVQSNSPSVLIVFSNFQVKNASFTDSVGRGVAWYGRNLDSSDFKKIVAILRKIPSETLDPRDYFGLRANQYSDIESGLIK